MLVLSALISGGIAGLTAPVVFCQDLPLPTFRAGGCRVSQRRLTCSVSELGRKRARGCLTSVDIGSPERGAAKALFGSPLPRVFVTQEGNSYHAESSDW